jgi:hypothetical protein
MKTLCTLTILLIYAAGAVAQTNTFPASGNVGIGTTSPVSPLDIYSNNQHLTFLINKKLAGMWPATDEATTMTIQSSGSSAGNLAFATGNTEWMRITSYGYIGIGTTTPGYKLDIAKLTSGEPTSLKLSGSATRGIQMRMGDDYSGTFGTRYSGAETFVSSNSYQSTILTDSWTKGVSTYGSTIAVLGISPTPTSPAFQVKYSPANTTNGGMSSFFTSDLLTILGNGNVGIGTTSPSEKLSVNGRIRAKEVIVETTGWSDYVFDENHQLKPLSEVERHIKTARHLPGVPSAATVAGKGVSIGDMQAVLLAKIEELTLYLIAQEKRQSDQEQEIARLRAELQQLRQGK